MARKYPQYDNNDDNMENDNGAINGKEMPLSYLLLVADNILANHTTIRWNQ